MFSKQKFSLYLRAMRFDKPVGIYLLLWPTLSALWLANHGAPSLRLLIIFILGTVLMRAAGCLINDFADRNIDQKISRTHQRPLTSGKMSVHEYLFLFLILIICAFILVIFLNPLTISLSFIALFLAMLYPFTKRFFPVPQLFLGLAYGFSVPMAFAASTNSVSKIAWIFYFATIIWSLIYDTFYALTDKPEDELIGVKSSAIFFGRHVILILNILEMIFLSLLILMGWILNFSYWYYLFIGLAAILFFYQMQKVKTLNPKLCFQAFLQNHWVGFLVWIGILLQF